MQKTILLVFIHGFKGGDDTFGTFPEHLRALLSHALPNVDIRAVTYPRFETRGDLGETVARFREWLQNQVIDIEVSHSTPSPTIDPSVHTVLLGHSMGGIVAAETLLLLASEELLPHPSSTSNSTTEDAKSHSSSDPRLQAQGVQAESGTISPNFLFPHVIALIAYDTPFLGISPGVVAHGAESNYKTINSAYTSISEAAGIFGWNSKSESPTHPTANSKKPIAALPAPSDHGDAAATPGWQKWGRYAMFAGAAGAVAAAGAGLYSQRNNISAGLGWVTSHLEFVGCLARGEELRQRVEKVTTIAEQRGLSVTQFYTCLGRGASGSDSRVSESLIRSKERTFCNLPRSKAMSLYSSTTAPERASAPSPANAEDQAAAEAASGARESEYFNWQKAVNDKSKDETTAHVSMFFPKDNPGFYGLLQESARLVRESVNQRWYMDSKDQNGSKAGTGDQTSGKKRGEEEGYEEVHLGGDGTADVVGHGDPGVKGDQTVEEVVEEDDAVMVSSVSAIK